jgi:hypothetical protein
MLAFSHQGPCHFEQTISADAPDGALGRAPDQVPQGMPDAFRPNSVGSRFEL